MRKYCLNSRIGGRLHTRTNDGSARTEYLHRDHLGSVAALSNADGDLTARMSYSAFGQRRDPQDWLGPLASSPPGTTDRGYTGHEMLDGVGLIHMNGRVYDPGIGRFVSPDPIIQAPQHSQSYNRYSYVWNNPLSAFDPSGFVANWDISNECIKDRSKCTPDEIEEIEECQGEHGPRGCAVTDKGKVIPLSSLSSEVQDSLHEAGTGNWVQVQNWQAPAPDADESFVEADTENSNWAQTKLAGLGFSFVVGYGIEASIGLMLSTGDKPDVGFFGSFGYGGGFNVSTDEFFGFHSGDAFSLKGTTKNHNGALSELSLTLVTDGVYGGDPYMHVNAGTIGAGPSIPVGYSYTTSHTGVFSVRTVTGWTEENINPWLNPMMTDFLCDVTSDC